MDFSLKAVATFALLSLALAPSAKAAEVFYAPALCGPEDLMVFVTNTSSQPVKWWTQIRDQDSASGDIDEIQNDIDANSEMKISGKMFLPDMRGFSIKAALENTLHFTLSCGDKRLSLSGITSPEVTHSIPAGITTLKMHLLNLYLNSNNLNLKAFDRSGVLIEEKQITLEKYYDTSSFKWILSRAVGRVEIKGAERFHSEAFFVNDLVESQSPPLAIAPVVLTPAEQKTYFLVSPKGKSPSGSFVIALNDSDKISTAREQITHPELDKIVVARIALGSGNFNRSFNASDRSPYSWSVTDVDAFADFAHIDCDGSPDLTEERLEKRLNEGGRICFWRYRVVRELTSFEVSSGILNLAK